MAVPTKTVCKIVSALWLSWQRIACDSGDVCYDAAVRVYCTAIKCVIVPTNLQLTFYKRV